MLEWDALAEATDATEDALFWTLVFSHARGCVDVRESLGMQKQSYAGEFVPVDAVRSALGAAGYSWEAWKGLAVQFGEFSSVLAMKTSLDVYSKVAQSLGDALAKGQTKAEWVKANKINDIGVLRDNPWYISNVFRTNTSTYYAAGKWDAITNHPDLKEVVESLEFIAIQDERTTPVCSGMDGTIKPVDDPIWATHYPPNHYMCRSTVEAVSKYSRTPYKNPTKIEEPGKGFATNVGQSYQGIIHEINSDLAVAGLSQEATQRGDEMKSRIISSELLDK